MEAYYRDGRGRYGTGESYDWFYKYEDMEVTISTSADGLWTYTGAEDGIELLRYNGCSVDIIVPKSIDGKKVIDLDSTFDGFHELKSVVVPDGVKSITGAFFGCEGLEKVILPRTLVDMTYALNCCYSLSAIDIPLNVKNFSWAFEGTRLEAIIFPSEAETIAHAFSGSDSLKKAFIPKMVSNTTEAFYDCSALAEVVIEEGVKRIDKWTFYHCPSLTELTIPKSVEEIEEKAVGFMEIREYTNADKSAYQIKGEKIVPGFQIKGEKGSFAEQYAQENGICFAAGEL